MVVHAVLGIIDVAGVASIMTLLGVMQITMGDLGRVVEYRQNYRAALRILAPISAQPPNSNVRSGTRSAPGETPTPMLQNLSTQRWWSKISTWTTLPYLHCVRPTGRAYFA